MFKRLRHVIPVALSIALIADPASSAQLAARDAARDLASPAIRAAQRLRMDKDWLKTAEEAAELAEEAAKRAQGAFEDAKRALKAAREATKKAVAAAREAKLALETARASALRPSGPLPMIGRGKARNADSAETPAARAFRAKIRRHASRAEAKTARARKSARPPTVRGAVLRVGPGQRYGAPSEAARVARDGDVVEIAAGVYVGDVAVWRADNLIIRGVGGRPHLKAAGNAAGRKAIWIIAGDNTVVENIEFSGAKVRGRNGAGIRLEGTDLIIRDSYFHHNQMGLLTGRNPDSDVVIENSEFSYNIVDPKHRRPLGHNIYIGAIRSFTLRNSYVHHATFGHNVKTRAAINRLLYNRLADEGDGNSSYIVDMPNGGAAYLIGNVIQQSRYTDNWSLINFGSKANGPLDGLYLAHNTMVSERKDSRFVSNRSDRPVMFLNNILVGKGRPAEGPSRMMSNLMANGATPIAMARLGARPRMRRAKAPYTGNFTADKPGFVDITRRDYRLSPYSPAIDLGRDPGTVKGISLLPELEFASRTKPAKRRRYGPIDLGAFEFIGE